MPPSGSAYFLVSIFQHMVLLSYVSVFVFVYVCVRAHSYIYHYVFSTYQDLVAPAKRQQMKSNVKEINLECQGSSKT